MPVDRNETVPQRFGISRAFGWPLGLDAVWLVSPLFVIALTALLSPVRPFDYFWSLVQGRACAQLMHVPRENLFLFTLPVAAPFFDQPWLGQLLMFGAERAFGHSANVLLLVGCLVLSFAIAMDTALRLGARDKHVAWTALLAVPLVALGSGVRTQMFAYPCFALLLRIVALRARLGEARALLLAAFSAALWANVHGSFVLAPLLCAACLLEPAGDMLKVWRARAASGSAKRALTRDIALLAAVSIGTFVNPRGPQVYTYVVGYGRAVRVTGTTGVSEWQAPNLGSAGGGVILLLFAASLALAWFAAQRGRLALGALLVLFALASLTSQRFFCWWALTGIVLSGVTAEHGLSARSQESTSHSRLVSRGPAIANLVLLFLLAATLLAASPGFPLFERLARAGHVPYAGERVLGVETPVRIGAALRRSFRGRLFHDQALGGFVEWVLAADAPKAVAFVDQRFELTPDSLWDDYFQIYEARGDWQRLLERYAIDGLLIHEQRAARLVSALSDDPEWRLRQSEFGYRLYTRRARAE